MQPRLWRIQCLLTWNNDVKSNEQDKILDLLLIPQHSFLKDNEMFTIPNSQLKAKITAKSYSLMFPGREKPASGNNIVYLLKTRSAPR